MDDTAPSVPDPPSPLAERLAPTPLDAPMPEPVRATLPPFTPPPVPPASSGGLGWRMGVALGLIAFLIGVGATALVLLKWGKASDAKPVATVTLPVGANGQAPVVIVPSKNGVPAPAIDLAALSARQAQLAASIGALEARAGDVNRESQRALGYATRGEGLMIAFAARRALDRGLNLGYLDDQLRERFGAVQPAAVATILQAAREPVTLEDLRAGLDGIAPELMTGAASSGWWASFRHELGTMLVLRKAGTPSPLPIDRVARARRLIEAGQVEAALAEVSRTPGAAQAQRWSGAARRYIGARRALDTLEAAAISTPAFDAGAQPVAADVPGMGSTPPAP